MFGPKRSSFRCPECGDRRNNVIDSRKLMNDTQIRRRRECQNGHRYTTYEHIEPTTKYELTEVIPGIWSPFPMEYAL